MNFVNVNNNWMKALKLKKPMSILVKVQTEDILVKVVDHKRIPWWLSISTIHIHLSILIPISMAMLMLMLMRMSITILVIKKFLQLVRHLLLEPELLPNCRVLSRGERDLFATRIVIHSKYKKTKQIIPFKCCWFNIFFFPFFSPSPCPLYLFFVGQEHSFSYFSMFVSFVLKAVSRNMISWFDSSFF